MQEKEKVSRNYQSGDTKTFLFFKTLDFICLPHYDPTRALPKIVDLSQKRGEKLNEIIERAIERYFRNSTEVKKLDEIDKLRLEVFRVYGRLHYQQRATPGNF